MVTDKLSKLTEEERQELVKKYLDKESTKMEAIKCYECDKILNDENIVYQMRIGYTEDGEFHAAENVAYFCTDCWY